MPTDAKRQAVSELVELLRASSTVAVADYRGLKVSDMQSVRGRSARAEAPGDGPEKERHARQVSIAGWQELPGINLIALGLHAKSCEIYSIPHAPTAMFPAPHTAAAHVP